MHHLPQASPYILLWIPAIFIYVVTYVPLSLWHASGPALVVSAACARISFDAFNLRVRGIFAQVGVNAQQPADVVSCCE